MIEDLKTGVLLCEILHFHQPRQEIMNGVNLQGRSKKPCINNIEKALQVLYQRGAPTRVSANQI